MSRRNYPKPFKSRFEYEIAKFLNSVGIAVKYETERIKFIQPEKNRTYTPDFILPNGIILEAKGRFVAADRTKHKLVRDQHPELDIRFVFMNPRVKLSKKSKTTYGDWATKNGFQWCAGVIPREWLEE